MSELKLNNLQSPPRAANKKRKRIARGNSGKGGTYAGKGLKGQKARSGVSGLKLKGMKKRLLSIPKLRGFNSLNKKVAIVNVENLQQEFEEKAVVSPKSLVKKGLIKSPRYGVKILGNGEIKKALNFKNVEVSASARDKIIKAGGTIE